MPNLYTDFISSKSLYFKGQGIDNYPIGQINSKLFDFQRDIVQWSLRRGKSCVFGDCGCVAPETVLQSPEGDQRIDDLAQTGKAIRVFALDAQGNCVVADADPPFLKGTAPLYRILLCSGRSITVTGNHRFLAPYGWTFASELLAGGRIAVSSHGFPEREDRVLPSFVQCSSSLALQPFQFSFFDTILAIHYIRTDAYYDLHVPGYENYLANGIWNHNTGKTPIQLEWARIVSEHTSQPVIIFAPLAVSKQTQREGIKFSVPVTVCRKQADVREGVNISNYEMLQHFDPSAFGGIVLDESSCLKSYGGIQRQDLTRFASGIDFRLACTATPAPNDYMELGTQAEFIGIMRRVEMLSTFFIHDGGETSKWRLKGHGKDRFWKWMASWSIYFRKPSDLGYEDRRFILPKLIYEEVVVPMPDMKVKGKLFATEAKTLQERRHARRDSTSDRVSLCTKLVCSLPKDQWLIWCDLNNESSALKRAIPGAVEVRGSDPASHKETALNDFAEGRLQHLITKPSIAGWGMNFQRCHNMAFVGLSDSWEQLYQATRRCWRFGQVSPVTAYVITSALEGAVVRNIHRKEQQAAQMAEGLLQHMKSINAQAVRGLEVETTTYSPCEDMRLPRWL